MVVLISDAQLSTESYCFIVNRCTICNRGFIRWEELDSEDQKDGENGEATRSNCEQNHKANTSRE